MTSPRKTTAQSFTRIAKFAAAAVLSLAAAVPATGALTSAGGEARPARDSQNAAAVTAPAISGGEDTTGGELLGAKPTSDVPMGATGSAGTRPAWLRSGAAEKGVGGNGSIEETGRDFTAEQMLRAVPVDIHADQPPKGSLLELPSDHDTKATNKAPRVLGHPSVSTCEQSPIAVAPGGPGYCQNATPTAPAATTPAASTVRSWSYNRQLWGTDQANVVTRTTGRIFWTNPSTGRTNSCTGTVVNTANQSVVWTAGHCVHGGRGSDFFRNNWRFVPAYHNGEAPYGQFAARDLWTTTQWMQNGTDDVTSSAEDIGAAIVGTNATGRTLMQAVGGAQGITFNQSTEQQFVQVGYPAKKPFDGSVKYACINRTAEVKTVDGRTPSEIGVGCDMTGGSSGGPWLIGVRADGLGYVNSVTSWGYDATPQMYGPYHGATAAALFSAVQAL